MQECVSSVIYVLGGWWQGQSIQPANKKCVSSVVSFDVLVVSTVSSGIDIAQETQATEITAVRIHQYFEIIAAGSFYRMHHCNQEVQVWWYKLMNPCFTTNLRYIHNYTCKLCCPHFLWLSQSTQNHRGYPPSSQEWVFWDASCTSTCDTAESTIQGCINIAPSNF